jgi:hemerythrin-like metal-binding protein
MTWSELYCTGVAEIDAQHRQIISLINALDDAMALGHGEVIVGTLLTELVAYCATHFATEESLFDAHGYPGALDHKQKHLKMTAKVHALQADFQQGKSPSPAELLAFLERWLNKHILETDQKYVPFLTGAGVH